MAPPATARGRRRRAVRRCRRRRRTRTRRRSMRPTMHIRIPTRSMARRRRVPRHRRAVWRRPSHRPRRRRRRSPPPRAPPPLEPAAPPAATGAVAAARLVETAGDAQAAAREARGGRADALDVARRVARVLIVARGLLCNGQVADIVVEEASLGARTRRSSRRGRLELGDVCAGPGLGARHVARRRGPAHARAAARSLSALRRRAGEARRGRDAALRPVQDCLLGRWALARRGRQVGAAAVGRGAEGAGPPRGARAHQEGEPVPRARRGRRRRRRRRRRGRRA